MASEWVRGAVAAYRRSSRRKLLAASLLVLVIAAVCVYSLSISRIDISFTQAMGIVWNHVVGDLPSRTEDYAAWWTDQVVVNDNAPRTVAGVCVGAILAACGAVIQSVTRNPLTDPYTLGISSAALFGVTVSIVFGVSVIPWTDGYAAQIANAFVMAMVPALAIVAISSFKRTSATAMVLIGIAVMYMFNAFTTFIKFNAEAEEIHEIYSWSLGTLANVDWSALVPLAVTTVLLAALMMAMANRIDVIGCGDSVARGLGEDPVRVRLVCFIIISMATAVAVCFTGTIGFVGLVAPHVARLFVGSGSKVLVPTSMVLGALMVVGADCLVRLLPQVLPVGVITALIGSPLFLYFLYVQRRKAVW